MTTTITFEQVRKEFGSGRGAVTALDEVSFEIAARELAVVVGPSGCGKSTLLDLLAGLTTPTGGQIRINGEPVSGTGLDRGIVFQQYALLPWRTASGNVEFGLEAKGIPRSQRRTQSAEYLELVGLAGFAERYPHELSGGMKQRVAIARSLAFDPDVLLMDEPFAALDAQTRDSLQEELLRIWENTRKTVLFITHSIDEAVFLGQRVTVLTPRPATVSHVIDIPFTDRLAAADLRSSEDFRHYRHAVWQALHGAAASPASTLAVSGVG